MALPAVLIPLLIQVGSKLIDMAFDYIEKMPVEKASKVLDKVEKNEKKKLEKQKVEDDDVQW